VSALLGGSAAGAVVAACLQGRYVPLMGAALFAEYESKLRRATLFARGRLNTRERDDLFDIFASMCRWTRIYYLWRPNLPDETDNHVLELAIAGAADALITRNTRDFGSAQLRFPNLRILRPERFIKE